MQEARAVTYREFTGWPTWVNILVAVAVVSTVTPILMGAGDAESWSTTRQALWVTGLLGFWGLLLLGFGGLLVTVERDGVRIGLGRLRILKTFVPFREIASLESITYRPLRDFGGWGLRGTKHRRAWTARGNEAVRLVLRDGRELYIGSDRPRGLESRIRNAMSLAGLGV